MTTTLTDRTIEAQAVLARAQQEHVLQFVDQLDDMGKNQLLTQIEAIDWLEIAQLIQAYVKTAPAMALSSKLEPAPWYPHQLTGQGDHDLKAKYQHARLVGEDLIRDGKVAAFTVAGGQGTRLGWDGPKGTFPATPLRKLPLFACLAECLVRVGKKYGHACPWYIMTSPINDASTRAFFEEHRYFGLDPADVMFFPQGMLPAFDLHPSREGKVLLDSPSSLALSPNGHGGSLKALYTSGAIRDMQRRGVEQISYTQIDNPLVKVIDPLFIGLHAIDSCQMSSKMLPKAYPKEKLGNFCMVDGRVTVIEYSDLPDELAEQRIEGSGDLRFRAGSIAIHLLRVEFVQSLNEAADGFALPYHRALKKVPYIDLDTGRRVEPDSPNALKLETFVFDALPLCTESIIYETERVEEFAPIKNAQGIDSAESSQQLQVQRAARWLESHGVHIARDAAGAVQAAIEIRQTTAIEPEDLKEITLPDSIEAGEEVLL